jgi:hypothetical protein
VVPGLLDHLLPLLRLEPLHLVSLITYDIGSAQRAEYQGRAKYARDKF